MIRPRPPVSVLHLDPHPVTQTGLATLLDAHPWLEAYQPHRGDPGPDVIVLEIASDPAQEQPTVAALKRRHPEAALLVLSRRSEDLYANRCLRSGAKGYLSKRAALDEVIAALESVARGSLFLSQHTKMAMMKRYTSPQEAAAPKPADKLSDRELLIVEQISLSKNNKEIAEALQLSPKTVESQRSRIKSKLGLDSPQALVRYAMHLFPC